VKAKKPMKAMKPRGSACKPGKGEGCRQSEAARPPKVRKKMK
jgi:hypothetical protein